MPRSVEFNEGFFAWPQDAAMAPHQLLGLTVMPQSSWRLDAGDYRLQFVEDADLPTEGYRLQVRPHDITIEASSRQGRIYAVQTLRQLIGADGQVSCVQIEDAPRFGWRGMMLDPSRHFLPVPFVLKFIDLLVQHKFNRLHLHLCDDQGWRIEIKRYPKLTEVGGWRKATPWRPGSDAHDSTPHGGFYTQDDIRTIVRYAEERGITVMPEIELPGHCQAALAAYPELGNTGVQLETSIRFGVHEDVYNVEDGTLRFLEEVLEEVLELFPSEFIHIGGDEVPKVQWAASPSAQAKKEALGLPDEDALQSWFVKHFDRWLADRGRRLVGWDEILEGGLAPGATVMSWRGFEGGIAAAKLGHDVVMAPTSHCYFDHYQTKIKSGEPTAIGGYLPLEKVYAFEPIPSELTGAESAHVLGGQGQLWSEYMREPAQVEYMALPRLCALGEVLWGKAAGASFDEFSERLEPHMDRLEAQGYRVRRPRPEIPASYRLLGNWPLDSVGQEGTTFTFAVPEEWTADHFHIAVHYTGGAYGVWIDELVYGTETVRPSGTTGNYDENNMVAFAVPLRGGMLTLKLRSKGEGALERNTQGEVYLVMPDGT